MSQLTNNYRDCTLIKVEPQNPGGPYVVVQEAFDPEDPQMRSALFLLQHDGTWIEEIARTELPDEERFEVVFETLDEVMKAFEAMPDKVTIERLPVTAEAIENYLANARAAGGTEAWMRGFLVRYRNWKAQEANS